MRVNLPQNETIIYDNQIDRIAATHKNKRRTRWCTMWIYLGLFIATAPFTVWAYQLIIAYFV